MPREVTLVLGAYAWSNWASYEVAVAADCPAGTWTVDARNPTPAQLSLLTLGSPTSLMVGTRQVLRGYLDRVETRRSRSGTSVRLSGRSLAAPLVDCCPPASWSWRQVSLATLAEKACSELGVPATVEARAAEASALVAYAKAEPGETYWQVLERYARKARIMPWMSGPGTLALGRPDYTTAPVAELVIGLAASRNRTNVQEASRVRDLAGRYSSYTVLGQGRGGRKATAATAGQPVGRAADAELVAAGLVRPLVLDDGDLRSTAEAQARAEYEASMRLYAADVLECVVPGHGPSLAEIWAPDSQVTVLDELNGISGTRWISAARFLRDREGGTRTALTLRVPGTLLPAVVS